MGVDQLSMFAKWMDRQLMELGINEVFIPYIKTLILLGIMFLIMYVAHFITRRLLIRGISRAFEKTETKWDDMLLNHGVFRSLAHIVPALIAQLLVPVVFFDFPAWVPFVRDAIEIYLIIFIVLAISNFLNAVSNIMKQTDPFRDKPVDSYVQLAKIIMFIIALILVLSIILNQSPLTFLTAFGAMTAILLLIFKDTILGLVASVQMSANDMVRVGDWVSMPKNDADGDVIKITLATVQVQNWDKTISNIPTYAFVSDSFKNYRGMQESGGRRIKRAIKININSIKFCDPGMVERFEKFQLIKDYVSSRQHEIDDYNTKHHYDKSELINGRHMTNIGVFRRYAETYLQKHPHTKKTMTMMVRQLEPTEQGLPIEIYCFTDTVVWGEYEGIQSDLFDHLLAAASYFELQVFQSPSGKDFATFTQTLHPGNS